MNYRIFAFAAAVAVSLTAGCAGKYQRKPAHVGGVRKSLGRVLDIKASGGVPAITYTSQTGNGTTGYLECVYLNSSDATNHPTTWQKGTAPNGPWGPATALPVATTTGVTVLPMYSGSTYRDYYVKFTPPTGDTAPIPLVRVYPNYRTTVKLAYTP